MDFSNDELDDIYQNNSKNASKGSADIDVEDDDLDKRFGGFLQNPASEHIDLEQAFGLANEEKDPTANDAKIARMLAEAESHDQPESPAEIAHTWGEKSEGERESALKEAVYEARKKEYDYGMARQQGLVASAQREAARERQQRLDAERRSQSLSIAPARRDIIHHVVPSYSSYSYSDSSPIDRLYRWALGLFPHYDIYDEDRVRLVRKAIYDLIKKYARAHLDDTEIEDRVREYLDKSSRPVVRKATSRRRRSAPRKTKSVRRRKSRSRTRRS